MREEPLSTAGRTGSTWAGRMPRELFKGPVPVLVGLALLAAALFAMTTLFSGAYRRMQAANSRHWFEQGQSQLRSGHPRQAADSFRNALSFHRDQQYLFLLSQALVAAGEYQEARGYLLNLWDRQPGRGELNLALARLEVRTGAPDSAVRYYQNAIYGAWDSDPDRRRREVRFELADFLLGRGDRANAEADLIALTPGLPHDFTNTLRAAQLFYAVGDRDRALHYYEEAARLKPSSSEALRGAGNTAFDLGNYALASQYLERARAVSFLDEELAKQARVAEEILRMDPLQRGLSGAERSRRTIAAWKQAISTIRGCAQKNGLDVAPNTRPQSKLLAAYSQLAALKPDMTERKLLAGTDAIEIALGRISTAESATVAVCGELSPPDRALQLIANEHGITPQ